MSDPIDFDSVPPLPIADALGRADAWFLMLDFDGTLAPIVPRPDDAALPESTRGVLRRLIEHPGGTLAILSGRPLDDVRARVGLDGICYAGNHGLEIVGPGIRFEEPTASALRADLSAITDELRRRLGGFEGALIEAKGLTTTVHDRLAPPETREAIARTVAEIVGPDDPRFVVKPGKQIHEVRPRVDWDKGRAAHFLIDALGLQQSLPIFIGDDKTDEDAFLALPDGITIHVGDRPTAARYRVPDVPAAARFLAWMADR